MVTVMGEDVMVSVLLFCSSSGIKATTKTGGGLVIQTSRSGLVTFGVMRNYRRTLWNPVCDFPSELWKKLCRIIEEQWRTAISPSTKFASYQCYYFVMYNQLGVTNGFSLLKLIRQCF